jgi:hypothetical protein
MTKIPGKIQRIIIFVSTQLISLQHIHCTLPNEYKSFDVGLCEVVYDTQIFWGFEVNEGLFTPVLYLLGK